MAFTLVSVFSQGQPIPRRFTCDGRDISPPLHWKGAPAGTKSFALIVDDPDAPDPRAPERTWVHWVLYDIPADTSELEEGVRSENLPAGTHQGLNDWGRTGYGGPCPPIGRHRYFFKLFALDKRLGDLARLTSKELQKAMQGQVLGHTELIGTYQKSK